MKLFGPSKLGNILIVAGLLLLLYIPASYGWTELQGTMLQAQLRAGLPASGDDTGLASLPTGRASATTAPARPNSDASTGTGAAGGASGIGQSHTAAPGPAGAAPKTGQGARSGNALAPATATPLPSSTAEPTATPPPTAVSSPTPAPVGPPVRIVFAALRIDTGVTQMGWTGVKQADGETSEWQVPENTAGWAINSASLGVPGNVVLAGHNNIYGMVFRNISLAWPQSAKPTSDPTVYTSNILDGRTIELYAANGKRFEYEVTGFYRIQDYGLPLSQLEQNTSYMQPTEDPQLTLITCWPPWSNTHRLVVRARLVQ